MIPFAQVNNQLGINFMPQAVSDIYFNNYQPEFSYSTGINYLLNSKSKLGFETDLLLSYQKGFYLHYREVGGIATEIIPITPEREQLYFFKIPVLIHFRMVERAKFSTSVIAGLQPVFLLKGISKLNDRTRNDYISTNYSFVFGIGAFKKVSERINLLSQFRLEYISDIQEFYNMPGYSIGVGNFFAGLMIGLAFNNKPSENNQQ